jgi:uncharacterized protein
MHRPAPLPPPLRPELPEGVEATPAPDAGEPRGQLTRSRLPAWPLWAPFVAAIAALVAAVVGAGIIAIVAEAAGAEVGSDPPPGVLIGSTVVQDLAIVVAAWFFARLVAGRVTPRDFGLRTVRIGPAIGWLALAWFIFLAFSAVYAAVLDVDEEDDLPQELGADESTVNLLLVAVLVTVLAPVAEELFFRGFLFPAMWRRLGLAAGVIGTGALFGVTHAGSSEPEFLAPLAVFGAALCLLYKWTGSLLPCMVLHALNNSLALGVSQDWGWEIPVTMLLSCGAILAVGLPLARSPGLNARAAPA